MLVDDRVDQTAAPTGATPPEPPRRRPYWPAALLMLGVLVALLGAALVLDQRFRPRPTLEPAAVAAVPSQVAAVPTAPSRPATPTAVPAPGAAPAVAPSPTAASTPMPTVGALPPALAATASALPSAAADLFSPLQKEVIDAYLRYWDVRIRAFRNLDPSHLSEVMAGDELTRAEKRIADLKARGQAGRIEVDHNFRVLKATPDEALVYDEYVNRSVFIDAATNQDIPTDEPPTTRRVSYELRKVGGVWKVIDGEQHD